MFIVSIDGGLGNQMFEYAFFLAMKERFPNSQFYLDMSMLKKETHNGYELDKVFGIEEPIASLEDVAKYSEYCPDQMKYSRFINFINKFRRLIFGIKQSYIIQEDSTAFYDDYFKLSVLHSYYLRGVWANALYFEDIREKILQTFMFPKIYDKRNILLKERIENTNSISIHFRMGDYKKYKLEILPESYYINAMDILNSKIVNPCYYVFSDDIASAKKVIGENEKIIFVEGNYGEKSYIDMQLMSLCKHNIIANSTFSFWGAYLNKNINKNVIYPLTPLKGCSIPYADINWIGIS